MITFVRPISYICKIEIDVNLGCFCLEFLYKNGMQFIIVAQNHYIFSPRFLNTAIPIAIQPNIGAIAKILDMVRPTKVFKAIMA